MLTAGSTVRFLLGDEELEVAGVVTENVTKNPKTKALEVQGTPHLVIRLLKKSNSGS